MGGFATVFEVMEGQEDHTSERWVAKRFKLPRRKKEKARADGVKAVLHEYNVTAGAEGVYMGEDDRHIFIVLPRVRGVTMEQFINDGDEPLTREVSVNLMRGTFQAMQAAYRRRIVHNDIGFGNLIVDGSNSELKIKLIDFGLAVKVGTNGWGKCVDHGEACEPAPEVEERGVCHVKSDYYMFGSMLDELGLAAELVNGLMRNKVEERYGQQEVGAWFRRERQIAGLKRRLESTPLKRRVRKHLQYILRKLERRHERE